MKKILLTIGCLAAVPATAMETTTTLKPNLEKALTQLPLLSTYRKPLFIGTAAIAAAGTGYMIFRQLKQQKPARQYRANQEKAEQLAQQVLQKTQTAQGYTFDMERPLHAISALPFGDKHLLRVYTDNSRGPESVDQITAAWPYVTQLKQKASDYYLPRASVQGILKDIGQENLATCTFTDRKNKLLVAMTIVEKTKIHFKAMPANNN